MKCKVCGKKQEFCIPVSMFVCSCGAVHEDGEVKLTGGIVDVTGYVETEEDTVCPPIAPKPRRVLKLRRKK